MVVCNQSSPCGSICTDLPGGAYTKYFVCCGGQPARKYFYPNRAQCCAMWGNPCPSGVKVCAGDPCPGTGGGHGGNPKPTPHCTKITSGPYTGHCVGDQCGPGGAGSVMSNGLCSRTNPPGGGGAAQGAAQVEFDLIQTLRSQLGAAFVNQNESCIRSAIHNYTTNFSAMQTVPYQGTAYNNYKTGLIGSLKQNYICIYEGGSKPGGQMACTGGQMFGVCSGAGRPAVCNVDCNNIGFFDSLVNGLPPFCNDANCCRQAQANTRCSSYGAGGGPPAMMGGGGAECIGLAGINCTQLGLIGAVAIFGLMVLIVVKR